MRVGKDLGDSIIYNSDIIQRKPIIKGYNALSQKFYRVRLHIKIEDLYLNISSDFNFSPETEESLMFEKYASHFGELPPFNGQYGGSEHWELFQK